ncbi:MAG: type II toxin-antitoxin system HicB family antitoxin [Chloroflexota bacterium]|nr:type II toxin-antitoxin system HicB family antitoxin [Chloroflexota bacterium]
MTRYDVYLEVGEGGVSMAHVLQLPGCAAGGDSLDDALANVVDAIADYYDWLGRHADPSHDGTSAITIELAEITRGVGPFQRGDKAAIFGPDREPLSRDELETCLRYAGYSRLDLLAQTRDLPENVLDWRPGPDDPHAHDAMTVREILRHVGNAEEWFVSRLVSPERLPVEWQDDTHLPIFNFLAMQRRTATKLLRELNDDEREAVLYPTWFTDHADEPWTARKALRRLLEHEREHTRHIRELLAVRHHNMQAT